MSKIRMKETKSGSNDNRTFKQFLIGQTYEIGTEISDHLAKGWVSRKIAEVVTGIPAEPETPEELTAPDGEDVEIKEEPEAPENEVEGEASEFDSLSIEELVEKCKELGIKKIAKKDMNKETLIKKIKEVL